jgi:hypothetical protein
MDNTQRAIFLKKKFDIYRSKQVLLNYSQNFKSSCQAEYKNDKDDCLDDLGWSHYSVTLGSIVTGIFGTPVAGAVTYITGTGTPIGQYNSCKDRAKRDYNLCLADQ